MGLIAATTNMPSAKFVNPANLDTIPANTNFTIQMAVSNLAIGEARYSIHDAKDMAIKGGSEGQNIQILAAVAALCNDAVFDASTTDMPVELRQVNGDATGT